MSAAVVLQLLKAMWHLICSMIRITFLDVRTLGEHKNKSIRGTKCIPLQEIEQRLNEFEDKKGKKIIVYCRSGNRSKIATKILNNNGFYAYNLSGGINQWRGEVQFGSHSMVSLKGKTTMRNVLGTELVLCSKSPMTGFRRDGFCRTDDNDRGLHPSCGYYDKGIFRFY